MGPSPPLQAGPIGAEERRGPKASGAHLLKRHWPVTPNSVIARLPSSKRRCGAFRISPDQIAAAAAGVLMTVVAAVLAYLRPVPQSSVSSPVSGQPPASFCAHLSLQAGITAVAF